MTEIRPFKAVRPDNRYAEKTAALPYDVFTPKQARQEAWKNPLSFINIDRPETQFPPTVDMYDDRVYARAADTLHRQIHDGIYRQDPSPCLYIYELTFGGRIQTGIVGLASVSDYKNNVIKRHELTRKAKEDDRCRHIRTCMAQTGPVFLAYRHQKQIDTFTETFKKSKPDADFVHQGVRQRIWVISQTEDIKKLCLCFKNVPEVFIADGHHRAAAAVRVCGELAAMAEDSSDLSVPDESKTLSVSLPEQAGIMSVFFPDNQLKIYPYFRVVRDLGGMTPEQFLNALSEDFFIEKSAAVPKPQSHQAALYLNEWFILTEREHYTGKDPVKKLDVSMVQEKIIEKQLHITDVRTDPRIDFIGGIYGAEAVHDRCHEDMAAGFMTAAVTMKELFEVARSGALMPPKSTWFEPKLRSGLFIHALFADKITPYIIE